LKEVKQGKQIKNNEWENEQMSNIGLINWGMGTCTCEWMSVWLHVDKIWIQLDSMSCKGV